MYEEIKTALIKMEQNPKVNERTRLHNLIADLSTQIRRTMDKGYTLDDIAQTLRDVAEIDIKTNTLATYLRRYGKAKPKRRMTASSKPVSTKTEQKGSVDVADDAQETQEQRQVG